ncbi:MAG TPA: phenylacetate--CoA ligase family protein [Acidimicrobiia bacterium]|nr:phenylacetate--CoA ligase family protein [Acidimicrobiia bacterium]
MPSYDQLQQLHVADAMANLPGQVERLGWSAERLAAYRREALRLLVGTAQIRSPWHRRRLAGVDPDRLDEAGLAALPVMTKDDLMGNFDDIVTDPQVRLDVIETHLEGLAEDAYLLGRYHAVASGGSSGRRGVFVYDWDEWTLFYLGIARYELWLQQKEQEEHPGPVVLAAVAAGRASHASKAMFQTFSSPTQVVRPLPVTLPLDEIVAGLNQIQPDVLMSYPSALLGLAHEAAAGRLRISPRRIRVGAEPLLPEIRLAAEQTWGVPVLNCYGASEAGGMGISCGEGPGLHLVEDLVIVEPVDDEGRPVGPGERSTKLYVTNLYNTTLPLIRYELTDELTLTGEPCPCGSVHRVIADPQGRLDETFRYGDLAVHPLVFRSPLGLRRHIVEYQVHQTSRGADVAVCCTGLVDLDALRAELVGKLSAVGLRAAEVTVTPVDHLARQDTGKLKRFIPLKPTLVAVSG